MIVDLKYAGRALAVSVFARRVSAKWPFMKCRETREFNRYTLEVNHPPSGGV